MTDTQRPASDVELLCAIIGFDSVNSLISGIPSPEAELAAYLEAVGSAFGLVTQRLPIDGDSFNLLLTSESDSAKPWLIFESHMDTVGVQGMTIDPFGGEVRDGRIFGRGACDTKGTGAAMLWALREYASSSDRPNNVALLFTTDEEMRKTGIKAFTERQMANLGWTPAAAIVGEPTMLAPIVAHNGFARWITRTRGVAAHSSDPSKGRSAISDMMKVVAILENEYAPALANAHPLTGKAQCTVNMIRGGSGVNTIPDTCEIEIDRRVVPGESAEDVLPVVDSLYERLRREDPELRIENEITMMDSPLDPAVGRDFVRTVQDCLNAQGLDGTPQDAAYGTDAAQFSESGIPAIVLGPGDIAQAHSRDEWLSLDQLTRGVEIYGNLMRTDIG
jgi:acetylornithine deacetylase